MLFFDQDYLMSYMNDEDFEPFEQIQLLIGPWPYNGKRVTQSRRNFPKGLYNVAGGFVLTRNGFIIFSSGLRAYATWTQQANFFKAHIRPFVHF